ncbi:MAG: hypothetical protein MJA82_00945 [Clostridia bacterium]|nr:hypothetical protein [Clostridia bacterium]
MKLDEFSFDHLALLKTAFDFNILPSSALNTHIVNARTAKDIDYTVFEILKELGLYESHGPVYDDDYEEYPLLGLEMTNPHLSEYMYYIKRIRNYETLAHIPYMHGYGHSYVHDLLEAMLRDSGAYELDVRYTHNGEFYSIYLLLVGFSQPSEFITWCYQLLKVVEEELPVVKKQLENYQNFIQVS